MAEQALIDRLKRYSKKCLTERTDGDFADAVWEAVEVIDGLLNDLQEALDTIEELTDTNVGKWIPVTERLPDKPINYPKCELRRTYYLVALESGCVKALGYDFDRNEWHISGSPVTHWMPLPESPKDGE